MKTFTTQADMQALENRYGPAFAQYLADQMAIAASAITAGRPIEFLDVKQANDTVAEHRLRIREIIAHCRTAAQGSTETAFLRRQIAEMRTIYRSALLDSHALMNEYLRRLQGDGIAAMHVATQYAKAA